MIDLRLFEIKDHHARQSIRRLAKRRGIKHLCGIRFLRSINSSAKEWTGLVFVGEPLEKALWKVLEFFHFTFGNFAVCQDSERIFQLLREILTTSLVALANFKRINTFQQVAFSN